MVIHNQNPNPAPVRRNGRRAARKRVPAAFFRVNFHVNMAAVVKIGKNPVFRFRAGLQHLKRVAIEKCSGFGRQVLAMANIIKAKQPRLEGAAMSPPPVELQPSQLVPIIEPELQFPPPPPPQFADSTEEELAEAQAIVPAPEPSIAEESNTSDPADEYNLKKALKFLYFLDKGDRSNNGFNMAAVQKPTFKLQSKIVKRVRHDLRKHGTPARRIDFLLTQLYGP